MADQWISAATARALVAGPSKSLSGPNEAICTRAHHGLLAARCVLFTIGSERRGNAEVPREFWWADGGAALEQDWSLGDFGTWIDQKVECRAFGVTFSLKGLLAMIPAEQRGPARRSLSAEGSANWISATDARLVQKRAGLNEDDAANTLIHQAFYGFVPGRAALMEALPRSEGEEFEQEWDIPDIFWATLYDTDWDSRVFSSYMAINGKREVRVLGVYFALPAFDLAFPSGSSPLTSAPADPSVEPNGGQKGRPPPLTGMNCGALFGARYTGATCSRKPKPMFRTPC